MLWGKHKGALGGQREGWWAAETEGEGNREHKALGEWGVTTQQQKGNYMRGSRGEKRGEDGENELEVFQIVPRWL